jgi:2,3-bisphosphoglycerate-independent phosphoglycerate mutase
LKIVYVLLDGIGDLPHPDLNGLTPLEAAKSPNLDKLAQRGIMGEVITVGKGIAPQSDIAVFNMLGYDFKDEKYVGRGVIEIIGSGIDFKEGDLALRGNFATVNASGMIIDRRAGRIIEREEALELCQYLEEHVKFSDPHMSIRIIPTVGHRVIVRFRHSKISLSERITNTDPAYEKINGIGIARSSVGSMQVMNSIAEDDDELSNQSAKIVNEFSRQCLLLANSHAVNTNRIKKQQMAMNIILLRDPGNRVPYLIPISQKYGISASSIVDMPVEIGIAKTLGIQAISAGGIDGFETKAQETAKLLNSFDLIYVHLKGPDEFGHDGNALGKKENIESIDNRFFGTLLNELGDNKASFIISGDHSTPCVKKAHSDDPVPLLISTNSVSSDGSKRFTESYASKGSLGLLTGANVMATAIRMIKNADTS